MINMNIKQLIKSASTEHASNPEIVDAIKLRIKTHPAEVNEKGLLELTPCHIAVLENQPQLLEILAIEGNADLDISDAHGNKPDDLANSETMHQTLQEIRKEIKRKKESNAFHLHDYIHMLGAKTGSPSHIIDLIQKRIAAFPDEVNEKTYWGRTATHWAMFYGLTDLLPILLKEGKADLTISDLSNHAPMDLLESVYQFRDVTSLSPAYDKKVSKEEYSSVFATLDEKKAEAKDLSINYITDSLAQLKLHHEEHDARSVRGRDKYAMEPLKLNKGLANYTIALPRKTKREALLDCYPVCDEIKKDNVEYVKQFLQEGNSQDMVIPGIGMPLIYYAFTHSNKKIFRFLLSKGSRLQTFITTEGENIVEKYISYKANKAIKFLVEVRNSFINIINIKELQKSQQTLNKHEKDFHVELLKLGLSGKVGSGKFNIISPQTMETISKKTNLPLNLVNTLYDICSCLDNQENHDKPNRQFEPDSISQKLIALAAIYSPCATALALKEMYRFFSLEQKLIAYFIVKELIINDDSFVPDVKQYFYQISVPFFIEKETSDTFDYLKKKLIDIKTMKMSATPSILEAYYALEFIISQNLSYTEESSFLDPNTPKSPKQLAHELKALTLQFYHGVNINEFIDMRWQKEGKEIKAPHILNHQMMFDKISYLIKNQILTNSSKAERAKIITLWVSTLKELLDNPMPDYNSAMIIVCSLSHSSISRLKSTFDMLGKDAKATLALAEDILSPLRNFKKLRKLVKENPNALPFTGVILRDITYAYENHNLGERLLVLGPILKDFVERQNRLRMIHLPLRTDLAFQVLHLSPTSDEVAFKRSVRLEPPILSLINDFNPDLFKSLLCIYIENGQELIIESREGMSHGIAGFNELRSFLISQAQQGMIEFKDAQMLLKLAYKTISSTETYHANPICFIKKTDLCQSLTLQFENTKNDIPGNNSMQSEHRSDIKFNLK